MKKFFIIPGAIFVLIFGLRVLPGLISGPSATTDENGVIYLEGHFNSHLCETATSCQLTTKVYTIHESGIDVDVGEDFYLQCENDKYSPQGQNSYCKKLILPGKISVSRAGARVIKDILENDNNPPASEHLEKRREALMQKILLG